MYVYYIYIIIYILYLSNIIQHNKTCPIANLLMMVFFFQGCKDWHFSLSALFAGGTSLQNMSIYGVQIATVPRGHHMGCFKP